MCKRYVFVLCKKAINNGPVNTGPPRKYYLYISIVAEDHVQDDQHGYYSKDREEYLQRRYR